MRKEKYYQYNEKFRSIVDTELNCKFELVEKEYMQLSGEIAYVLRSLKTADRRIMILYSELGSLEKVAKIYNCSQTTIRNHLKSIKQKFKHLYENRHEFIDQSSSDDHNYRVHHRFIRDS